LAVAKPPQCGITSTVPLRASQRIVNSASVIPLIAWLEVMTPGPGAEACASELPQPTVAMHSRPAKAALNKH